MMMDDGRFWIAIIEKSAWKGLEAVGTSGSGNHFVEFGVVDIVEKDEIVRHELVFYLELLSHSRLPGTGANV